MLDAAETNRFGVEVTQQTSFNDVTMRAESELIQKWLNNHYGCQNIYLDKKSFPDAILKGTTMTSQCVAWLAVNKKPSLMSKKC